MWNKKDNLTDLANDLPSVGNNPPPQDSPSPSSSSDAPSSPPPPQPNVGNNQVVSPSGEVIDLGIGADNSLKK